MRNMSVSRYLSLYKESTSNRIKLLDHAGYSSTENSVFKTVELSVNHVRMNSLQAFALLESSSMVIGRLQRERTNYYLITIL